MRRKGAACSARASSPEKSAAVRRLSGTHRLLPEYDSPLAVGDEGHPAVLGDDDRQTVGVIVDEAIGCAVARADIFDLFWLSDLPLGVDGTPNPLGSRELGGHFSAEAEHVEALVQDQRTIDGGEIREYAAMFEQGLFELLE